MGQHLYSCRCCGVHGIANYVLRPIANSGTPPEYENVLVCTACRTARCVQTGACQKPAKKEAA